MPRGVYQKSESHKKALSLALSGRKLSEETKHKMSLAKHPSLAPDPKELPSTIRPQSLEQFVGNEKVKQELLMIVKSAKEQNTSMGHTLITGSPGSGKTALAHLMADASGGKVISTHASLIKKQIDLRNILTKLDKTGVNPYGDVIGSLTPTVIVIDEIHELKNPEMLYAPMEQRIFPWRYVDQDSGEVTVQNYRLPPFTLIGVSDRAGELSQPLLERFGITFHLELYTEAELMSIIRQAACNLHVPITEEALAKVASSSKGVPRLALAYLLRIKNIQVAQQHQQIDLDLVQTVFELIGVHEEGLTAMDVKVLKYLERIKPNKVGLARLATLTGISVKAFQNSVEPFLLQRAFVHVAPGGRVAGVRTHEYLKEQGFLKKEEDGRLKILE